MLAACLAFEGQCSVALSQERARNLAHESISILRGLPTSGRETVYALALLSNFPNDEAHQLQIAHEALQVTKANGGGWWIPVFMLDWSHLAMRQGEYAQAKALAQEALAFCRQKNYQANHAQALNVLSRIAMLQGDYAQARQLAEESLSTAEAMGYQSAIWWIHSSVADNALLQGDFVGAQAHYQAGLEVCQELNEQAGSVFELTGLGCADCGLGNYLEARRYFFDALQLAKAVGHVPATLDVMSGAAWLLANTGKTERALQLAAYVLSQPSSEYIAKARSTHLLPTLETILSPELFTAAMEEGKRLDFDETVSALLAEFSQSVQDTPPRAIAHTLSDPLTERELEVLRYIAEGLSNYDIATRLFVGVSTVKTHINHIYGKLDVKSRTQAIAQARELNLL
jgi:LuxR family maltose regulon positive regulatory protein